MMNNKINQVTELTLVVGIDIAKHKHYATFVDERGRQLRKAFPVMQTHEGFKQLYQTIVEGMKEHGKTEAIVGVEPTGHYWLNLAYYLADHGIPLVIVNPMHVKRVKELDDNLQTKNDKKDALTNCSPNEGWPVCPPKTSSGSSGRNPGRLVSTSIP
ncbi:transposase, partial [Pantoea sp. 3_1284]|uniref:IS110 family transposase n=1 Tax=Pantoea sp. 3_1284 TaxID=2259618 RepID=UPI0018F30B5E